ncbi:alpha/beta fold hydrolase [Arthrobacter liuii]|uniref:Alpha/beta hydrolase n=1 Tax=Arthrobacter liuii TaxID=1476996 RepID=A0ABQ2AVS0_9MICC|nr:alpha/beta hydrolase [Arthrobacter liuii]GGH96805.1 alpha/beta hydrolase [Arthrobacter liuii]
MAGLVDIDGHPTWVEDLGGGAAPLLLLHGGLSNSDALLATLGPGLSEHYRVIAFDRRGHGYTADTAAEFHYAGMAREAVSVLEKVAGGPAHLVGWSDGGIIALLVALQRPDLAAKLVVIGTNYHVDGIQPVELDPGSPVFQELGRAYVERSPDGPGHLEEVIRKSMQLTRTEPSLTTEDLARIQQPVLVVAGDDDLVALPHTVSLYEALPNGQLAVVPGASHALPLEQPATLTGLILPFLAAEGPPQTLMPIRRARTTATDAEKAR